MQQNGRKGKKLLAVQIYQTQMSNFKRSTAPIWLCVCFGILVCSYFSLNQLLSELNSIEHAMSNEQHIDGNNRSKKENQSIASNGSDRVIMIYFNNGCIFPIHIRPNLFILRTNIIQNTMKIIYVQIGHFKYPEPMIRIFYIFGQNQIVGRTGPTGGHVVKTEVHSFQSMVMNLM